MKVGIHFGFVPRAGQGMFLQFCCELICNETFAHRLLNPFRAPGAIRFYDQRSFLRRGDIPPNGAPKAKFIRNLQSKIDDYNEPQKLDHVLSKKK